MKGGSTPHSRRKNTHADLGSGLAAEGQNLAKLLVGSEGTLAWFERLQSASHKLAEVLYSQAGAAAGAPAEEQASSASASGDSSTTATEDNVIDAEYVDVDEEKK